MSALTLRSLQLHSYWHHVCVWFTTHTCPANPKPLRQVRRAEFYGHVRFPGHFGLLLTAVLKTAGSNIRIRT